MDAGQRAEELLVDLEIDGLDASESRLLDELLIQTGLDRNHFARSAAAVTLASRMPLLELPSGLKSRLVEAGQRSVAQVSPMRRRHPWLESAAIGWYAAAAMLLLAVGAWWPGLEGMVGSGTPAALAELVPAALERERLLASGTDLFRWDWAPTDDPAAQGLSGDVVWSAALQAGFMRFRGLQANNPAATRYQLWVFDADRDDRYPVDGGVFDMPAGATEVVVPIRPGLPVGEAVAFAVTVESPGGAVVSTRERIVALAAGQG
ncbi:MAG: anti-sigma factor domain-containing protein [Steroidobacteraceae bacterium]